MMLGYRTVLWFLASLAFLQAAALYMRLAQSILDSVRGALDPELAQQQMLFYALAAALAAFCGVMGLFISVLTARRQRAADAG